MMTTKDKILKELKSIILISLYFIIWYGTLMIIKILLLKDYKIEFYGASIVVIGALVTAKAVLLLELVPLKLNKFTVIVRILLRTLLYLLGVAIILILEHAFEARNEYGGFMNALGNLSKSVDFYHILVNIICVFGALFFYNLGSAINDVLGKGGLWKLINSPIEDQKD